MKSNKNRIKLFTYNDFMLFTVRTFIIISDKEHYVANIHERGLH